DEALLVGHPLRGRHALPARQPAADRRPVVAHGPAEERRRLGGHLLRAEGAEAPREQLDSHRPGAQLVLVLPSLRTHPAVLRPGLAAGRLRGDPAYVIGVLPLLTPLRASIALTRCHPL